MNALKITIETLNNGMSGKLMASHTVASKEEGKTVIAGLMKKYNMIRHAGHIVNYKQRLELWTNF